MNFWKVIWLVIEERMKKILCINWLSFAACFVLFSYIVSRSTFIGLVGYFIASIVYEIFGKEPTVFVVILFFFLTLFSLFNGLLYIYEMCDEFKRKMEKMNK